MFQKQQFQFKWRKMSWSSIYWKLVEDQVNELLHKNSPELTRQLVEQLIEQFTCYKKNNNELIAFILWGKLKKIDMCVSLRRFEPKRQSSTFHNCLRFSFPLRVDTKTFLLSHYCRWWKLCAYVSINNNNSGLVLIKTNEEAEASSMKGDAMCVMRL